MGFLRRHLADHQVKLKVLHLVGFHLVDELLECWLEGLTESDRVVTLNKLVAVRLDLLIRLTLLPRVVRLDVDLGPLERLVVVAADFILVDPEHADQGPVLA